MNRKFILQLPLFFTLISLFFGCLIFNYDRIMGSILSLAMCSTIDKEIAVSPDGYLSFERYSIDCGAAASTKTYVNVFKTKRTWAKEDNGETVVGVYSLASKEDLVASWSATDTIKVIYRGTGRYKIAGSNRFGIKIDWKTELPPELEKYRNYNPTTTSQ